MIGSKMKSTWMLGLLLLLGSCQQKGPASGRVEMKGESDSLSVRHGQENACLLYTSPSPRDCS